MQNQESTTTQTPWEKVCERQGKDPVKFLPYPEPKDGHERFMSATAKMTVIVKDKRQEKKISWTDGSWKYMPWMDMTGSGPSFDGVYGGTGTASRVGSRLCSLSSKEVNDIAEEFPDVLHDMFQEEG